MTLPKQDFGLSLQAAIFHTTLDPGEKEMWLPDSKEGNPHRLIPSLEMLLVSLTLDVYVLCRQSPIPVETDVSASLNGLKMRFPFGIW